MAASTARIALVIVALAVSACATATPRPSSTAAESSPPPAREERTETRDETRPEKGEEIDLGLEGDSNGKITVEDSGATPDEPPPEESGENPEGENILDLEQ